MPRRPSSPLPQSPVSCTPALDAHTRRGAEQSKARTDLPTSRQELLRKLPQAGFSQDPWFRVSCPGASSGPDSRRARRRAAFILLLAPPLLSHAKGG